MKSTRYLFSIFFLINILIVASCQGPEKKPNQETISGELIVFHAGSLTIPLAQVADTFNKIYPDLEIKLEPAGSVTTARKISDLGRECDVLASADFRVIEKLLIPEHTKWMIPFASNEMVLAYRDGSTFADKVDSKNWTDILKQDDVRYGRSDPNSDPCGYRTEIILKLAEEHYNARNLASSLLAKDNQYIRPKEVDLLSLLQVGEVDYIFIYRSVAEQHGLKYVLLPEEINLGNPAFTEEYSEGYSQINGKTPGSKITMRGEPMIYALTIPDNAPNYPAALLFAEFILNRKFGGEIMERNGQPSVLPAKTVYFDDIPDYLKPYIVDPEIEL
jgi:molybdate/tungstate transport system substrate-binding protein